MQWEWRLTSIWHECEWNLSYKDSFQTVQNSSLSANPLPFAKRRRKETHSGSFLWMPIKAKSSPRLCQKRGEFEISNLMSAKQLYMTNLHLQVWLFSCLHYIQSFWGMDLGPWSKVVTWVWDMRVLILSLSLDISRNRAVVMLYSHFHSALVELFYAYWISHRSFRTDIFSWNLTQRSITTHRLSVLHIAPYIICLFVISPWARQSPLS